MIRKILIYVLITGVSIVGIAFPIVEKPSAWYEFPLIPGLEENARIIFFHVPMSWLTVIAFFMSTWYSIKYLRTKDMAYDAKAYTSAQLGMVFCTLATITGAVWAKFAWGTFWNWDPRETSIFAVLLIFGALFALRSAIEIEEKRATLSAVYSSIAFVTVPFFIFVMPRIMKGLHPGSSDDTNSGPVVNFKMNHNMQYVFYISMIGFTLLYTWLWDIGYRSYLLKEKLNKKESI